MAVNEYDRVSTVLETTVFLAQNSKLYQILANAHYQPRKLHHIPASA
jgi:hypothetical protein